MELPLNASAFSQGLWLVVDQKLFPPFRQVSLRSTLHQTVWTVEFRVETFSMRSARRFYIKIWFQRYQRSNSQRKHARKSMNNYSMNGSFWRIGSLVGQSDFCFDKSLRLYDASNENSIPFLSRFRVSHINSHKPKRARLLHQAHLAGSSKIFESKSNLILSF